MKVFLAGATGALGTQLVPMLVDHGHEVVGMTRTASKQEALRALGARPVVADALDPDSVARAVAEAEPEVIVHQLSALAVRARRRPGEAGDRPARPGPAGGVAHHPRGSRHGASRGGSAGSSPVRRRP